MTDLGPYIEPVHHYALLEHVLNLGPTGTALEFGVATGQSTRLIAAHMPVIGFGSERGLPEYWRPGFPKGKFACRMPKIPNARMVEGWFTDTLPTFDFASLGEIGLCHIDVDLYSSTKTALEYVGPYLRPGCLVCFDEFHGYPSCEEHETRAFAEYINASGTCWEPVGHSHEAAAFRMVACLDQSPSAQ